VGGGAKTEARPDAEESCDGDKKKARGVAKRFGVRRKENSGIGYRVYLVSDEGLTTKRGRSIRACRGMF